MPDADDIDARFREMMLAEFGTDGSPESRHSDSVELEIDRNQPKPSTGSHAARDIGRPRSFLDDGYPRGLVGPRKDRQRPDQRQGRSLAEELAALEADAGAPLSADDFSQPKTGQQYWFSLSEALDNVELEPEPPYREAGSWFHPGVRGWLAIAALIVAVLLTFLTVLDVVSFQIGLIAGVLFGTALALALSMIPWRNDDDFSDGARL